MLADDKEAVKEARRNNVLVITTLGIFARADEQNLLDFSEAITELSKTNFRLPPDEIIQEILQRNADRQGQTPKPNAN